jgi:hypothetical protein
MSIRGTSYRSLSIIVLIPTSSVVISMDSSWTQLMTTYVCIYYVVRNPWLFLRTCKDCVSETALNERKRCNNSIF